MSLWISEHKAQTVILFVIVGIGFIILLGIAPHHESTLEIIDIILIFMSILIQIPNFFEWLKEKKPKLREYIYIPRRQVEHEVGPPRKNIEPQLIVLHDEKEIDKVLKTQLFLETPESRMGGRNWDEIKETVYYEECKFSEMKEGDILVIHGDIGLGKTTYLLFFVADSLRKGKNVIFIDPSFIEGSLKELRDKKGQIIAIDAFERVKGDFEEKCSELIDFARLNRAKIILTMRSHRKEVFKSVADREHYEVKEEILKPQVDHIPYIVANYLLFFNVNTNGLNAKEAYNIIYNDKYKQYPELKDALKIIKGKSNASPFYIFHSIKDLQNKKLAFEVSTIKDLPKGVEELLLNTLKTDFLNGGIEDNVFIAILICLSKLEKDFSIGLIDAIFEELLELFSLKNGEGTIDIIDGDVQNKIDQFRNHFMVRTTNFEVLLTTYWREAIEKALDKRITDDSLSSIFVRVNRRISASNVIENALKRGLKKSHIENEYFHFIADAAKQGSLDYVYKKFNKVKDIERIYEDKNYARYVLANEFLIKGNFYFDLKQYKKAIENYDKAIEIYPEFSAAYINCAIAKNRIATITRKFPYPELFFNLWILKDSLKYLETAKKLVPDDPHLHNSLGIIYAKMKQYDNAFSCFENAINLSPEDPLPYYNRAILYGMIKDYENGKKDYEKAIELKPDFVEARNKLAVFIEKLR